MREKALQGKVNCGKLTVKDGWLMCPACGRGKVLKVRKDTEAKNLVVHCKLCGKESTVNIKCLCQCQSASA